MGPGVGYRSESALMKTAAPPPDVTPHVSISSLNIDTCAYVGCTQYIIKYLYTYILIMC